jgi:hypothetical protein
VGTLVCWTSGNHGLSRLSSAPAPGQNVAGCPACRPGSALDPAHPHHGPAQWSPRHQLWRSCDVPASHPDLPQSSDFGQNCLVIGPDSFSCSLSGQEELATQRRLGSVTWGGEHPRYSGFESRQVHKTPLSGAPVRCIRHHRCNNGTGSWGTTVTSE